MVRSKGFRVGFLVLSFVSMGMTALVGCGQSTGSGGSDYSQDLQKIVDGLGAAQKSQSSTLSKGTNPSSTSTNSIVPATHDTVPDPEGWFTYTVTFESSGVRTTVTSRDRYYDAQGNILRDGSTFYTSNALERIESEQTSQSGQFTSSGRFQLTGLSRYTQFHLNPPQTAQQAALRLSGSGTIRYPNGFTLSINSLSLALVVHFPGNGTLVGWTSTIDFDAAWSAENSLYTGTLSGKNLSSQTQTITGDVYRAGQRIGTISVNTSTNEVTITDANGRIIRSSS